MTGSPPLAGGFAFPLYALLGGLEQLPDERIADAITASGRLSTAEASTLRLDRLFDIFFESYWCRYTGLTEVALSGILTGKARIEIQRRNARTGEEVSVTSIDFEAQGQAIEVPLILQQPDSEEDASYLIAVLHLAAGSQLSDLRWCASAAPLREVRLAGVICTFNREDMLASNLERVASAPSFLHRLFVVNQGPPGLANRIAPAILSQTPIIFIDQPNFGGAGGFTRGVIESLDDPHVTHVLLMDDDINLQPALLARIAAILAYTSERHCVGGAMLDIHEPKKLFTCGDQLHPTRPAIINIAPEKDCDDVTTDAGRDFVARHHKLDFNGWWCFTFPVEAVRQCGLPLPLFIRGDDVEFGFRLSRAGFPTIGWPGVAVWHLPFHLKVQPWQAFYDRRNMLFLSEAHRLFSRRRLARSAWGSFCNAIVAYDYARADAIIRSISAFNEGPSHLTNWSGEDHKKLLERTGKQPPSLETASTFPAAHKDTRPRDSDTVLRRYLYDLLIAFGRSRRIRKSAQPDRKPHHRRSSQIAGLSQQSENGARRGYDWHRVMSLSVRALPIFAKLRWHRRSDPDAILRLGQDDRWRAYLSLSPGNKAASCDKGLCKPPR